jgi:phosphate transport system permease protein
MVSVAEKMERPKLVERRLSLRTWTPVDIGVLGGSAISGISFTWLLFHLTPFQGAFGFLAVSFVVFALVYWLVVRDLEGPVAAADKLVSVLIGAGALTVLAPLVVIVGFVALKGVKALRLGFFFRDLASVGPLAKATAGGGVHAIVGTLEQVGLAVAISVPLAMMVAVFLNEVGGRLARPVRFVINAMSGVPSIVAGLFIFAVWIVQLGNKFSGLAGALALSVLMLPTVTRTSEEMLRIVPDGLREASLALGAPEWRTVSGVVLPTARAGLLTAVILGVARAVGETAPLIMTAFGASILNLNPFKEAQASLPLMIYTLIRSPQQAQVDRAWTGAFVLITLVLALFTLARVLSGRASGKRRRSGTLSSLRRGTVAGVERKLA